MKRSALFTLLIASTIVLTGCVKKCKLGDTGSDNGDIITDVIIYPESGYMTSNMSGDYHIDGQSDYSDQFQMSTDGGYTKKAINYSVYNILANPINVKCDAAFTRTVTIDNANQIVTYKIEVTECSSTCNEVRTTENYVLVPAFPSSYSVVYDVVVNEK